MKMNRRCFLKWFGLLGASVVLPYELVYPETQAARNLKAAILGEIGYVRPTALPKVITIFLYGGPSELAGNLTNIAEINANSQKKYPDDLLLPPDPADPTKSPVTRNFFWGGGANGAGGEAMESLIASGDMSVYRTIHRIKEDSKAHGPSVFQNLVGNLDPESPGIATTLAAILAAHSAFDKEVDQLVLPFVSFEGDSVIFRPGDLTIAPALKPVGLDSNLQNPYQRGANSSIGNLTVSANREVDDLIESLARATSSALGGGITKINEAFKKRAEIDSFIQTRFSSAAVNQNLPQDVDASGVPIVDANGAPVKIQYPNTNFGNRLKAAISLAVSNPDTYFISLGSGGLGGWDDHSDAIPEYTARMRELMAALNVAVKHMKLMGRNDIIINVFGDFGRNVNLNDSMGWDHGNNQNLYTLGGAAVRPGALGKIVGKTQRIGTPFENRQFTAPTDDSYQCEPFAIASSLYKYFGVQNPEILTGEPPIDEINPPNQRV